MSLFKGCLCPWKNDESCYDDAGSSWYRIAANGDAETWRCIACRGEWKRVVASAVNEEQPSPVEMCEFADEQAGGITHEAA